MISPIRTVVVGYGFAGRSFHAYLVGLEPRLALHGIVARSEVAQEKVRARADVQSGECRLYTDFDDVLNDDDVELVVIATPNDSHAPLAIAALEAGKNVVVDKPMCLSLDECDRMIAAARNNNRLLSVFHNRRWDGDFLTARQLQRDGALGEVRWIEMAWQKFGPCGGWRGKGEAGGGRFYDLGAHLLDQLLLFFPHRITGVYARLHHEFADMDTETEAIIMVHFEDEAGNRYTGTCDMSSRCAIPKPRFLLHGSNATFCKFGIDPQEAAMIDGDIDAAQSDPTIDGRLSDGTTESVIPTQPGRWRSYYENIAATLQGEAELAVRPEQTRRVMAVFEAARQSADSDQVVSTSI
ncbi:MAG TPA: Gfo/Idh/MocA family oxidoreductase [Abditibacteriaceae bacterium]|jgi:scyllo-inositol 2-dehydrogenase (NADP+)